MAEFALPRIRRAVRLPASGVVIRTLAARLLGGPVRRRSRTRTGAAAGRLARRRRLRHGLRHDEPRTPRVATRSASTSPRPCWRRRASPPAARFASCARAARRFRCATATATLVTCGTSFHWLAPAAGTRGVPPCARAGWLGGALLALRRARRAVDPAGGGGALTGRRPDVARVRGIPRPPCRPVRGLGARGRAAAPAAHGALLHGGGVSRLRVDPRVDPDASPGRIMRRFSIAWARSCPRIIPTGSRNGTRSTCSSHAAPPDQPGAGSSRTATERDVFASSPIHASAQPYFARSSSRILPVRRVSRHRDRAAGAARRRADQLTRPDAPGDRAGTAVPGWPPRSTSLPRRRRPRSASCARCRRVRRSGAAPPRRPRARPA